MYSKQLFVSINSLGQGVQKERFVSQEHSAPAGFRYDQPTHEWVMVLKGAARLQFEDRVVEMFQGDSTSLPIRGTGWSGPAQTSRPCGWRFFIGR